MNLGPKRAVHYVLAIVLGFFVSVPLAQSQAAPATGPKPQMAEDVFKNIQLLKGIPVKEFMDTMGFFSASTGLNCIDCHSPDAADSLDAYAIDTPLKQTARKMIIMVNMLDKSNFGGQRKVTCYTCHRATDHPEAIPSLVDQYSVEPDDPDRVEVISKGGAPPPNQFSADQDTRQIHPGHRRSGAGRQAHQFCWQGDLRGVRQRIRKRFPLKCMPRRPISSPPSSIRSMVTASATFDGTHGWTAASDKLMRVLPLAGGDLAGAKIDGTLFSGADQARIQVAHRLPIGLHRRQASRSHSGRRRRRYRRQIIF